MVGDEPKELTSQGRKRRSLNYYTRTSPPEYQNQCVWIPSVQEWHSRLVSYPDSRSPVHVRHRVQLRQLCQQISRIDFQLHRAGLYSPPASGQPKVSGTYYTQAFIYTTPFIKQLSVTSVQMRTSTHTCSIPCDKLKHLIIPETE